MSNPRVSNGAKRRKLREYYKRLGEPCHLCGKPIDYTLPAGHPMSFEIDEIVPISKGGSPYTKENTAPAHRICNQRRGNNPIGYAKIKSIEKPLPKSREW